MRTSEQYLEDLRAMRPNVYMGGRLVKRDDPLIVPGINVMRITFDMARDPQNAELFTATSQYTKRKINRFCNVSDSVEDLLHEQADPDMYVRVVKQTKDGIIVRGAKEDITMASYCDELIILPTRTLTKDEKQWAVSFAIPADWKNVHIINRASAPRERKYLKAPLNTYGSSDALVIFDDTFIPWDRVFMCGEYDFGGRMALAFATSHRHSYCGCKPAVEDYIMGLIALTAEYYGIADKSHIREKLAHLAGIAELIYAAGIAAAMESPRASSGTPVPNARY